MSSDSFRELTTSIARYNALGAAFGAAYCECAGVTVSEERLMDDLEHVRRTYVRD